jgi:hypothetical protein
LETIKKFTPVETEVKKEPKTKMKKQKYPNWKPQRRGNIYCAPACGGGCTWAAYQAAQSNARKLAKRMGKGWKTRVHENLGWHYNVISPCGRIKISGKELESYTAFLGDKKEKCCGGTWAESGRTPEEAMANVIKAAKHQLNKINAAISGL